MIWEARAGREPRCFLDAESVVRAPSLVQSDQPWWRGGELGPRDSRAKVFAPFYRVTVLSRLVQSLKGRRATTRESMPRCPWPFTLVFLHIPKTGGMSVRQTLLRYCAPETTFRIIHQVDDSSRFAALPLERRGEMRLIEGHMYYGIHEYVPRPCVYTTLLRDPVARVRSFYSYVCRSKWHFLYSRIATGKLSLRECIEQRITVELDNYMTRSLTALEYVNVPFGRVDERMYLIARAHLESIAIVGTTDRMDLLYRTLAHMIHLPPESPPHINQSTPSDVLPHTDRGELDELIREHSRYDLMLYEYAAQLALRRAAAMGILGHGHEGRVGGESVARAPSGSIRD